MKLQIEEVSKSFGEKEVLHQISFEVESGRAMGFLGRNGSGKTTTIRCVMDVFRPNHGRILLDGKPFNPKKNKVGYLPEERGMYAKELVLDQLIYFGKLKGFSRAESKASAETWLERFGLAEYAAKKMEILSKGNQQKVQIIQAFLNDPDMIILDEPFSGLDPVNAELFKQSIREAIGRGKLVVFSSHQMSYVEEFCDDVTLIDEGRILLSEDLASLKEQLGAGKFRVEAANMSRSQLKNLLVEMSPDILAGEDRESFIVDLDQRSEREFLSGLLERGVLFKIFAAYMPTLHEIFLQKVGGQAHEDEVGHE